MPGHVPGFFRRTERPRIPIAAILTQALAFIDGTIISPFSREIARRSAPANALIQAGTAAD
jgi:hypothetical protein